MTPIAIVQPAAPPTPPASPPPTSSGSKQFSSHFEKAVSDQKDQVSPRESKAAKSQDTLKVEEKTPTASIDNAGQESASASAVPQDQDIATDEAAVPTEDENLGMQDMQDLATALSSEGYPAASVFLALNSTDTTTSSPPTPAYSANPTIPAIPAVTRQGETVALPQIAAQAMVEFSSMSRNGTLPTLTEEAQGATAPPTGQKSTTDTLLTQLQQLIAKNDEKGTVTITRQNTPPSGNGANSVQMAWPQQVGSNNANPVNVTVTSQYSEVTMESPHVVLADGWNTPAEKSEQGTSLRQNTQQQYYEAKINLRAFDNNEESMAQDRQQGNESSAQGQVASAGQTSSTATSLAVDQTNTFAQSLATTTQTSSAQPATDAAKTLTLPSGTVVSEEDVIQQVMERFQISKKPLDTQINIKLHPAELGELKIDLTVKEGSIRANVVAQSQHAQEIIEKNMMKLRTVLEDHGFTVENITVSSKYDSTTDAGLFDRQLFSQNDYTPQAKKQRHGAEATFRFDEAFFPAQPATTGVNVKI